MSREIKFRAWGPNSKHMWCWEGLIELIRELGDNGEKIVMQYTGLKDKNGKKIYESDVLDEKYKWCVKWCAGGWWGLMPNGRGERLHTLIIKRGRAGVPVEVIGNIYENTELLENDHE